MSRRLVTLGAGVASVVCLAATTAFAAEGRIPIFEPTTIATSGSYVVTQDIAASGAPAITVTAAAETVFIDLNGYTVSLTTTGQHVISGSGLTSLKIVNGTIQRPDTSPNGLLGLEVNDTKLLTVEDVKFTMSTLKALRVQAFAVRRNLFPALGGIDFGENNQGTVPMTGAIEDNVIKNGQIRVSSGSNGNNGLNVLIRNNRVTGESGVGFRGILALRQEACVVEGNRIGAQGGTGISISSSNNCRISDNVVYNSDLNGISVQGNSNLVLNNVSNDNGRLGDAAAGSGIRVSGSRNHVEDNLTQDNALAGIYFQSGSNNTYGRNMARGNQANPTSGCTNPAISACPTPYGTGSSAPDLCDDATGTTTLCDNLLPGPPRS